MIYFFISVESLPTTHDSTFSGAKALQSLDGNGAILQYQNHFYQLMCNTSSCHWNIMEQNLMKSVSHAVMMYLPPGYTC